MIGVLKEFGNSDVIFLDGCPNGWVVCIQKNTDFNVGFIRSLSELQLISPKVCFIDMPVRLPAQIDKYPRVEDCQAKQFLGRYHSSIFYAPMKNWLNLPFHEVNKICENSNKPKLSKQSFNLFPKINQLQLAMNKLTETRFHEIHPELLVHYYLRATKLSKKDIKGQQQRCELIHRLLKIEFTIDDLNRLKKK